MVALEARGFILGGAVAHQLGLGFVPIRKSGKLPGSVLREEYELEYGQDTMELHDDALVKSDRVLIVDDLIATGGTCEAGIKLIRHSGAEIVGAAFIVDLPELGGLKKIEAMDVPVHVLCNFDGD